jgi:hypothetical protein
MTVPTDVFATYQSIGNREDLSDVIYKISPTETPFLSGVEKVKAKAVNHEWQVQNLAAASTANAVLEGDDATIDAATPTVRLGNIAQISDKVAAVTGTENAIDRAGRDNELSYQLALKGQELKRDMESILLSNQAKNAGAIGTARKTASILAWIGTNDSLGAGAAASPVTLDGLATRTDGTQRAFTEALLKPVLQLIWNEGGDPDTIMVGGANKQAFSTFTGRTGTAGPNEQTTSKKIVNNVEIYEGDFGTLKVVANRFMRTRDCLVLEMDKWAIAYLRNMRRWDLAKTGDSEKTQILCEYSLESRNEKASGMVADLTP